MSNIITSIFGPLPTPSAPPTPSPTRGLLIWAVLEAINDGEGTTVNYWAATDFIVDTTNVECAATFGQELEDTNENGHFGDLPASWAFTAPLQSTLTSCTWTASETPASAQPTVTGSLICPGLPSPVTCPPVPNPTENACLSGSTFSLPGLPGIDFDGDVASEDPLNYCLF